MSEVTLWQPRTATTQRTTPGERHPRSGAATGCACGRSNDWSLFVAWQAGDLLSQLTDRVRFPESTEAIRRWTETAATRSPTDDRFRRLIVAGEAAVGTINTHSCERRAGRFSFGSSSTSAGAVAAMPPKRSYFDELGYQEVTSHVYELKTASQRLHERLGFSREGRLRRMIDTGGRFWDDLIDGLTREEFAGGPAATPPPFGSLERFARLGSAQAMIATVSNIRAASSTSPDIRASRRASSGAIPLVNNRQAVS